MITKNKTGSTKGINGYYPRNSSIDAQLEWREKANKKFHNRAVEIGIWGLPLVSTYSVREAFFRDANARYGDIVYWSRFADWRHQFPTPDPSSYIVYFNYNTQDG